MVKNTSINRELTNRDLDDKFMTIYHKLDFSSDAFLEMVLESPEVIEDFLRDLIRLDTGNNIDRILTKMDKEVVGRILEEAAAKLGIDFKDGGRFNEAVEEARIELEKRT